MQGLLFVKIELKSLAENDYSSWHSDVFAPAVLLAGATDQGPNAVVRYKYREEPNVFATLCPLPDLTWLESPAWASAFDTVFKEMTRGDVNVHFRLYKHTQTFEGNLPPKSGLAKGLLEATIQLPEALDADYDQWYRMQHLDMLTMIPGYRRSSRYELQPLEDAKYTSFGGDDGRGAPKHETLHEFEDVENIISAYLDTTGRTAWSQRMLSSFTYFARNDWILVDVNGKAETQLGVLE